MNSVFYFLWMASIPAFLAFAAWPHFKSIVLELVRSWVPFDPSQDGPLGSLRWCVFLACPVLALCGALWYQHKGWLERSTEAFWLCAFSSSFALLWIGLKAILP